MNRYGIFGFCMVSFLVVFSLIRLSEFELSDDAHQRTINFEHHQDILEGTLILPPGKISPPLVVLVMAMALKTAGLKAAIFRW